MGDESRSGSRHTQDIQVLKFIRITGATVCSITRLIRVVLHVKTYILYFIAFNLCIMLCIHCCIAFDFACIYYVHFFFFLSRTFVQTCYKLFGISPNVGCVIRGDAAFYG